ncbi:MAG: hypothetical protein LQ338_006444 [Usnochroma carphineum]|nr:MAG: hypothetical protein LQ338_006444 [Usnochroma carphineum]
MDKAENEVKSDSYFKSMTDMLTAIEDGRPSKSGGNMSEPKLISCRTRFNDLTDLVNQKCQDACKTVDRCVYVDSEPAVDENQGRYCMPGINENYYGGIDSPVDGWNRERTIFYEWSTTKDDDEDGEKAIDQPEKRGEDEQRGESFISLETRSDTPGPLNNDTFEGAIGNWIIQGTKDGSLNVSAAQFGDVNAQGLPDWVGRVFHLTKFGNQIIANGIIRAMVAEQAKMMNQPADPTVIDLSQCPASDTSPSPSPVTPAQATSTTSPSPVATVQAPYVVVGGSGAQIGKCRVHVNEFEDCAADEYNLATEVTIWDVGGNQIGYQSVKQAGATGPLSVKSKLEDPLIVTPEHQHDYVQFTLGTENFDSTQQDQTQLSWCSTGGWDPREGPICAKISHSSERQMDCYFQCPYHGNKSSDGS